MLVWGLALALSGSLRFGQVGVQGVLPEPLLQDAVVDGSVPVANRVDCNADGGVACSRVWHPEPFALVQLCHVVSCHVT